jgi:hypothetical protein
MTLAGAGDAYQGACTPGRLAGESSRSDHTGIQTRRLLLSDMVTADPSSRLIMEGSILTASNDEPAGEVERSVSADQEAQIVQLTKEIPNYERHITSTLGHSPGDLWALYLGSSGKMNFPDKLPDAGPGLRELVPDTASREGPSRYNIWRTSLEVIIAVLGPEEGFYRTGYSEPELREAVNNFFGTGRSAETAKETDSDPAQPS